MVHPTPPPEKSSKIPWTVQCTQLLADPNALSQIYPLEERAGCTPILPVCDRKLFTNTPWGAHDNEEKRWPRSGQFAASVKLEGVHRPNSHTPFFVPWNDKWRSGLRPKKAPSLLCPDPLLLAPLLPPAARVVTHAAYGRLAGICPSKWSHVTTPQMPSLAHGVNGTLTAFAWMGEIK